MAIVPSTEKKIIRTRKDLPNWFDLKKYQDAKNLDAVGWYELLVQRKSYLFWLEFKNSEKNGNKNQKDINHYYEPLLQSRDNPLSHLTDDSQILLIGGGQLDALKYNKKDFATFSHAISPLTVRRLYRIERRLRDDVREKIRHYMDRIFKFYDKDWPTEEEHKWARSFIDDPIFEAFEKEGEEWHTNEHKRGHDFVEIDLTVPNKILIEQFTDYIRQVRRRYPDIKPVNPYKKPEYKKWVRYGLLPYLDLNLWEIENNLSIPYRVMADAIFPNGEKGEEMIRKTTKKMVDQVMSKDYIEFLATIAAQEIAEKI